MNISRTVRDGMLVTKHGDKWVRCGKHRKLFGIYQTAKESTVLTDKGVVQVHIPEGIVRYGWATVDGTEL